MGRSRYQKGSAMAQESFKEVISTYQCGISYKPTNLEPDPLLVFPELSDKIVHTILPIKSLDISTQVQTSLEACGTNKTFILVPGREFDKTGTRHGKGAGWYDRFLSAVPQEWLRIGICYESQMSHSPLVRESWDEPMDYVCVVPLAHE